MGKLVLYPLLEFMSFGPQLIDLSTAFTGNPMTNYKFVFVAYTVSKAVIGTYQLVLFFLVRNVAIRSYSIDETMPSSKEEMVDSSLEPNERALECALRN